MCNLFFQSRKYSKKSSRQCNQNCDDKDASQKCHSCKYEDYYLTHDVKRPINHINNQQYNNQKPQTMHQNILLGATTTTTDLNGIRNLSIDQSLMTVPFTANTTTAINSDLSLQQNNEIKLRAILNLILDKIEDKKKLIRKAESTSKVKEYLLELTVTLFESIVESLFADNKSAYGNSSHLERSIRSNNDLNRLVLNRCGVKI